MKVILISGKSGSGKDELAQAMRTSLQSDGARVLIIHFADAVKMFASAYYNWNQKKDEAGRTLLQTLGTDKVRAHYPEYWAEIVGKFISATSTDWDYVLIPDLRFYNEGYIVQKFNPGTIWVRINRFDEEGNEYLNPALTETQHQHASEVSLDDHSFDWYVINDGTIDDLRLAAGELIGEIC